MLASGQPGGECYEGVVVVRSAFLYDTSCIIACVALINRGSPTHLECCTATPEKNNEIEQTTQPMSHRVNESPKEEMDKIKTYYSS